MKLDISEPIAKIQKLESAFNKDQDNLRSYALLHSMINELKVCASTLETIMENESFEKVLVDEAYKIISGPKKREKIFRRT